VALGMEGAINTRFRLWFLAGRHCLICGGIALYYQLWCWLCLASRL